MTKIDLKQLKRDLGTSPKGGDVEGQVIAILRQHVKRRRITPDTHLVADLALDSLTAMAVVADVEEAFGVHVPTTTMFRLETVGDIVDYVRKKQRRG